MHLLDPTSLTHRMIHTWLHTELIPATLVELLKYWSTLPEISKSFPRTSPIIAPFSASFIPFHVPTFRHRVQARCHRTSFLYLPNWSMYLSYLKKYFEYYPWFHLIIIKNNWSKMEYWGWPLYRDSWKVPK